MVYLPPAFHHLPKSLHCPNMLELCRGMAVLVRCRVHLSYENQGSIFQDTLSNHCSEDKSISSTSGIACTSFSGHCGRYGGEPRD